jgi:hypothetical protein
MKCLLVVLGLCLLSSASSAQTPQNTYIGVFFDDGHASWCITQTPSYTVDVWFWARPGIAGFLGATFDIIYPGVELQGDRVYHPDMLILPTKCKPPCPGFSKIYVDCKSDWVWLFHQTILVASSEPMTITIQPFLAQFTDVIAYDCDNNTYPAVVLSQGYLNDCGPLPVEQRTWGAIKSLYR